MSSNILRAIEQKPHRLYIIYLITKKSSPNIVSSDLRKIGLSSAGAEIIAQYFDLKIKPMIKAFNLGHIYQDYMSSITRMLAGEKKVRFPEEIRFRLHVHGKTSDEINFIKFMKALGVFDMWASEIVKVYGIKDRIPNDPDTGRQLDFSIVPSVMPWKILESHQRHLIDEMIIDGVKDSEIALHLYEKHDIHIKTNHVKSYREFFFNLNVAELEDQMDIVVAEKENIVYQLQELDTIIERKSSQIENGGLDDNDDSSISNITDMMIARRKLVVRINDLNNVIATINASLSSSTAALGIAKRETYTQMFEEMMGAAYKKFNRYELQNDRAVVDPMLKCVTMMQRIMDMTEKADKLNGSAKELAQAEMINLIQKREEEDKKERMKAVEDIESDFYYDGEDTDISGIAGVDEINAGMPKTTEEEDD